MLKHPNQLHIRQFSSMVLPTLLNPADASGSESHVNAIVSLQTASRGLTLFSPKIQSLTIDAIGAALAGSALGGSFGAARAVELKGGGYLYRPSGVTAEQTLLIDTMYSWTLLVLAYGGSSRSLTRNGLEVFANARLVPSHTGDRTDPARSSTCLVAYQRYEERGGVTYCRMSKLTPPFNQDRGIWWLGPSCGY